MAVIEKFLGQRMEVPEDFRYSVKQGLWAKKSEESIVFGFTQPALVLLGGIKDLEGLVDDGTAVESGDSVVFAITGKILYIDAPFGGIFHHNEALKVELEQISKDPYGRGWIFSIEPQGAIDKSYETLASFEVYMDSLLTTEGFKNPDGVKGGVSGICKAVYTGIGVQKL